MAVGCIFLSSKATQGTLSDRLHQEESEAINYEFNYAKNWLRIASPRLKLKSGRYRYKAVPK